MKFCLDPRCSPSQILTGHSSNKIANLWVYLRASNPASSGLPAPIALEALPMPFDNCLWLNDDEDRAPVAPQMRQGDPKQTIATTKPRSIRGTLQNQQLLTQSEIFRHEYEPRHKQTAK